MLKYEFETDNSLVDEMGTRIDDLEKNIGELMQQAGGKLNLPFLN